MPQYTRVLCLGDSETFGARATYGRTYPSILEENLSDLSSGVQSIVMNRGINGERSWEIVDRGQQYLLEDGWIRQCITMMGTNDSKPGTRTPLVLYIKQWDRLLRVCRNTDTQLIALEIHAINPVGQPEYDQESINHIRSMNVALKQWAADNAVLFVDGLFDTFLNTKLLADGIHPTNQGNALIANRVSDVLRSPLPVISKPQLQDMVITVDAAESMPGSVREANRSVMSNGAARV